jgi:hypothetical protein
MTESTIPKKIGLELLCEPFPPHLISKLPKPTKSTNPKGKCEECGGYHGLPAIHIDYAGHAAITHRLLEADIAWGWEPLAMDEQGLPRYDKDGGLWIKLTVCGVTRLGYGQAAQKEWSDPGAREKELIGDALRNAAMRFGAALDLWSQADLHAETEEGPKVGPEKKVPKVEQKKEGPKPYPDSDFTKNFLSWKKLLEHGSAKKIGPGRIYVTADDLIAKIEAVGQLSDEQKQKLKAIKRIYTMAEVEAAMRAAPDVEQLGKIAAEQIAQVQSKDERSALMEIAEQLEAGLTGVEV